MPLKDTYDPKILAMMTRAIDDACAELRMADNQPARTMMALRMMIAVAAGESNPARLKLLALNAVDGRSIDG
jgi:hypothetical protein